MPDKYHIKIKQVPPRFFPVSKFSAIESEGCLGCMKCVKRDSCVYDVYKKRQFSSSQVTDTVDVMCISCMRCVQECKKNILFRVRNPQFESMGDDYWKPDILASIWKQAETGSIPVSGAGYRGPFVGTGFDRIWTDMSEIVRPTRDGIHGREYISTIIELGRRPERLEFDEEGKLLTEIPPFVEIPVPIVLNIPRCGFVADSARQAIAQAAGALQTFAIASLEDAADIPAEQQEHLIVKFDPGSDDPAKLGGIAVAEIDYCENVFHAIEEVKAANPGILICVCIPLDEYAVERALKLATKSPAGIIHIRADRNAHGLGKRSKDFATGLVKEIHFELLKNCVRDQVTLLFSGGIAMAEHIPKIIACGVDGVGIDTVMLVALECRLCDDCETRTYCPVEIGQVPVEWAAQRIVNLVGSWHSQLIEVMGAMGLREVRRLRGELGRVMFFDDLERENFAPIFGKRICSSTDLLTGPSEKTAGKNTKPAGGLGYPAIRQLVRRCPSRFRNSMGIYKVIRTSACIACGKCAEVCAYGVHQKANVRMLAPKSHLCRGSEVCRVNGAFCINYCPVGAIRVGLDPMWQAFGDPRWTADLLASTWIQAETGFPPEKDIEYKVGESGGGFDRIEPALPDTPRDSPFRPEDVDISISLNHRNDQRPEVTIGIPFYGGGMSYGSISLTTMLARARAFKAFNSFTCTGEGGYPEELKEYDDYVITQVATGLFGVKEETIQRVRVVEFKYAQGAKPGLGGHLLSDKVTPVVAEMRQALEASSLFSPFPFHSVYSVEDHKKHVDWIKQINPEALVSVKVSCPSDVDMVAVGSYYAGAHIVHLDGGYGGTGAAPDIAKKNIAVPIEYAVPKVHRFLIDEGIRDELVLIASGGLRTAWDVAKIIALGADGAVIGTAELVALECIRCGACESGRGCPRGIATTDPELSALYSLDWATQRLINLFHSWAVQLQKILWRFGMKSVRELVGRSDLLVHLDYDNIVNNKDL